MILYDILDVVLREVIIILLVFFILLYIARVLVLKEIFYMVKKEYSFYFSKLNQNNLSFFKYVASGKSMSFSYKILFNEEYDFDEKINIKKAFYIFYSIFYYITLALMCYLVYYVYF